MAGARVREALAGEDLAYVGPNPGANDYAASTPTPTATQTPTGAPTTSGGSTTTTDEPAYQDLETVDQQTPQGQAQQSARFKQPSFGQGILGQRTFVLSADVPHTENINASTMKIISSTVPDVIFRVVFDESETFTIVEGANFAPGFQFRSVQITAPVDCEIDVQFGYAFQG